MLRYLCEKQRGLQTSPLKMCCLMRAMISEGCRLQDVVDKMCGEGLTFSSNADIQAFFGLYQELSNHTRMQSNRGYAPSELFKEEKKRVRVIHLHHPTRIPLEEGSPMPPSAPPAPRVGRNDPCPCGSGLKYKKCCGRPQGRPS